MVNNDFHRPTIALKAVDSFLISVTQFSIRVKSFRDLLLFFSTLIVLPAAIYSK